MKTSIVILNWNGRHFLEEYLPKVEACSQFPSVEIIVADNASTDDSIFYLQKEHPNVRIIQLDKNYGFAEGYNRALQQVDADYYVLLNSDVEVTEDWLQPMLNLMQQKKDIAACMPKIRSISNRDYFEHAGAAGGFIDKYGYTFCRGRLFHTVEKDVGQYDTEMEIFWATGACCMIRAKLFHEFGGFDNTFFAHMEEIDLCLRLKNAGYTIWFTPHSVVYHVGGGMLPQSSPFKTFLNYRNNLLMMYKNLPRKNRKRILNIRMTLDYVSAVYSLLKGNASVFKAVWKAHRGYRKLRSEIVETDNYPSLPRHEIIKTDNYLSLPCVYQRSVVYQYFIKGCKTFVCLDTFEHFPQ